VCIKSFFYIYKKFARELWVKNASLVVAQVGIKKISVVEKMG
jgi:hypothetical protein